MGGAVICGGDVVGGAGHGSTGGTIALNSAICGGDVDGGAGHGVMGGLIALVAASVRTVFSESVGVGLRHGASTCACCRHAGGWVPLLRGGGRVACVTHAGGIDAVHFTGALGQG